VEQPESLWDSFRPTDGQRKALPREQENNTVAEIGNPEKRRVLVPDEMPAPERVVPERTPPVKVPEKQPA
jgi:hypothetical protein